MLTKQKENTLALELKVVPKCLENNCTNVILVATFSYSFLRLSFRCTCPIFL